MRSLLSDDRNALPLLLLPVPADQKNPKMRVNLTFSFRLLVYGMDKLEEFEARWVLSAET